MPAAPATARLDAIEPRACSCGSTRRAFVDVEPGTASVHLLDVDAAVTHYHRKATEIYVVLEGEGRVELDGRSHLAGPLSAFLIPPGCRHRAVGELRALVIAIPAADDTDEYFDV
ncbi:cupin domain-containing protein [Jiangella asiatica]|uniref:Cupin domain-containing protein n=1 Tax=Jiangella asiatica TaxID=2530372 RepID=A0A4R5DIU4_9ACTN|nr:cupin domain-containing protein [Jiangella asiatica]TDE14016.1 cupin domain-containing protein [Jiangella asiatica]